MENGLYFLNSAFWDYPLLVFFFVGTVFLIVLVRYLSLSMIYAFILRIAGVKRRKAAKPDQARRQYMREIMWSSVSSLVFTVLGAGCFWLYQHNYTRIYIDLDVYPSWYFILSIIVVLILYETYYYWLHRWMHLPGVYRIVHKVHHDSIDTSVFTSFSFHPIEALLQFLFIPLVIVLLPLHYLALGTVLMLMTISAIVNHAGAEIFPKGFDRHPVGKWLIGSTHHDLHHREFRNNFGLYFTFWDKLMNTESERFHDRFDENTDQSEN